MLRKRRIFFEAAMISAACPYDIQRGDACRNAFVKRGFTWGGGWETAKDCQHFEKTAD